MTIVGDMETTTETPTTESTTAHECDYTGCERDAEVAGVQISFRADGSNTKLVRRLCKHCADLYQNSVFSGDQMQVNEAGDLSTVFTTAPLDYFDDSVFFSLKEANR